MKELQFTKEIIRTNPKNFQAWEHRRVILSSNLMDVSASTELDFTESILSDDPKNYSAWKHRQWSLKTFRFSNSGLMRTEFDFVDSLICADMRNNSAWNQRFFVLIQSGKFDFAVVKREIRYVIEKIKQLYGNESSWNYLRGIIDVFPNARRLEEIEKFLDLLHFEFHENKNRSPQLVAFIIDMKIDWILNHCECGSEMIQTNKVLNMCHLMAEQLDTIRSNYWNFVARKLLFDKSKCDNRRQDFKASSNLNWKYKIWRSVNEEDENFWYLSSYLHRYKFGLDNINF